MLRCCGRGAKACDAAAEDEAAREAKIVASAESIPHEYRVPISGDPALDAVIVERRVAALARVAEFKALVMAKPRTPEQRLFLTDYTFLRYLEARDSDVARASEMLEQSLAWRAAHVDGRVLTCPACSASPDSHCFLPLGEDTRGWQLIYSCAARAANKHADASVAHMSATLEKLFDGSRKPGKIVWLIDMHGFGWRDMDLSMATTVVPMFSNQYPERMGQIVIIDPPSGLKLIWESLTSLLDPITQRKIKMLRADKDAYFAEYCKTPAQRAFLQAVLQMKAAPGSLPVAETEAAVKESKFAGI